MISSLRPLLRYALAMAIPAVVSWLAVVGPRIAELDAAESTEVRLKDRYRDLKLRAVNLDLLRQQHREIDEATGALSNRLPDTWVLERPEYAAVVVDEVRASARRHRLRNVTVEMRPRERGQTLDRRRIDVSAEGEFADVVRFLQAMSTASGNLRTLDYAALSRSGQARGVSFIAEVREHGWVGAEEYARRREAAR